MDASNDISDSAADPGVSEEEALKRGMEDESKEFVEKGAGGYAQA